MKTIFHWRAIISITKKVAHPPLLSTAATQRAPATVKHMPAIPCRPVAATLGAILFAAVFALLPNSARAQCTQWDVSGKWKAKFSAAPTVNMNFTQSGNAIKGSADFEEALGLASVDNGMVDGDKFSLTLMWDVQDTFSGSHVEYYIGKIGPDGKINGTAIIFGDDSGNAKWSSDRPMKCADRSKPISRLKIKPTTGTDPVEPVPAILKAPGIIAEPNNIALVAGKANGKTTLTWDGGKDHPYAEVWVKVDEQDETKVVEQGKGTRQVTVVPGKTYVYMLEDEGKVLATVTVRFHR